MTIGQGHGDNIDDVIGNLNICSSPGGSNSPYYDRAGH